MLRDKKPKELFAPGLCHDSIDDSAVVRNLHHGVIGVSGDDDETNVRPPGMYQRGELGPTQPWHSLIAQDERDIAIESLKDAVRLVAIFRLLDCVASSQGAPEKLAIVPFVIDNEDTGALSCDSRHRDDSVTSMQAALYPRPLCLDQNGAADSVLRCSSTRTIDDRQASMEQVSPASMH